LPSAQSLGQFDAALQHFASERTLLAWVRTGITVIAPAFVVARFGFPQRGFRDWPRVATLPPPRL
jgi:uncharacterized membrane protein YidH (DUF202 family)